MLRVGITGGIGSGKTTVCQIFEHLGVSIYHADLETKKLYSTNVALRNKIIEFFGPEMYNGSALNREAMAHIVFNDPEKLKQLNAIVHPLVFEHYEAWCKEKNGEKYTLKEAAILFESESYKRLHYVIGVMADDEVRIRRTMERDNATREEVLKRMQNQMPQEELRKKCDFIVENDGSTSLVEQVQKLHQTLLKLSEKPTPDFKK